jgi:hypothetical protein
VDQILYLAAELSDFCGTALEVSLCQGWAAKVLHDRTINFSSRPEDEERNLRRLMTTFAR